MNEEDLTLRAQNFLAAARVVAAKSKSNVASIDRLINTLRPELTAASGLQRNSARTAARTMAKTLSKKGFVSLVYLPPGPPFSKRKILLGVIPKLKCNEY